MLISSIRGNSIMLGIFALVTSFILAGTHLSTKERIAEAQRIVAQRALLEIVPKERHDNDLLMDTVTIPDHFLATLGIDSGDINVARNGNQLVAMIIPATAPDGYNGDIKMIIGINLNDNTIAGVRVVEHKETPGLGDKVDTNKSKWVLGFDGKSITNPTLDKWKVKKDSGEFDQFTGATITPRAVVQQIAKALQYFQEDKQRLVKEAMKKPVPVDSTSSNDNELTPKQTPLKQALPKLPPPKQASPKQPAANQTQEQEKVPDNG